MKIVKKKIIVINAFSALHGGGQTYLINLLAEFCNNDVNNFDVVVLTNSKNKSNFNAFKNHALKFVEVKFASKNIIFRVLWEIFALPFFLKNKQADSYFAPGGIMLTKMPSGCKSFTALRNMLPFDEMNRKRGLFFSYDFHRLFILKYVYLFSYKISDGIIFISNYSRGEVEKYLPDIKKKSKLINHGINNAFFQTEKSINSPKKIVDGEYYLYVSKLDFYKAQKEVIREWLNITKYGGGYSLVLAGEKYNEYGEQVERALTDIDHNKINYIGAVDYYDLPSLYKNARALIFASSCECCPNILLEKLASGRPVICSNIMPMPEFGDDAVVYFDPYKKGSLERAVNEIETGDNLDKFSLKSSMRAKRFSWHDTASKTFNYLLHNN